MASPEGPRGGGLVARKKSADRQAEIADAAMRIIATKGARRFTAQLLAKDIGITAGAIYRHFESMEAVVDLVVERVGALLFEGFPPAAVDPIERLGLFFKRRTQTILANPHVSRLLLSEHLAQAAGRAQAERLGEFRRRSHTFVLGCLREARRDGTLSREISPEAGVILVLGSILRLAHARGATAGGAETARLAAEVWSAIERALRAPRSAMAGAGASGRHSRKEGRRA